MSIFLIVYTYILGRPAVLYMSAFASVCKRQPTIIQCYHSRPSINAVTLAVTSVEPHYIIQFIML
jgi:hypothetical protein